jgi:hypothetical protein
LIKFGHDRVLLDFVLQFDKAHGQVVSILVRHLPQVAELFPALYLVYGNVQDVDGRRHLVVHLVR